MKWIILLLVFTFFNRMVIAQSVSINTDGSIANNSAILDIKSTSKGLLIPRMDKAEKNAINLPSSGLLIYQNSPDSIGFHYTGPLQILM